MRERPIRGLCGARCIRCRTHLDACVCDVIATMPALRSPSRIHLLLHLSEGRKSTNTGWLATTLLGGAVHPVGRDLPEPTLPDDALLLTPDASRTLREDDAGRPLLVLDAAWRPARRLRRKLHTLHTRDTVALPESLVHERGYALRHDARESHLATAEAIALALGILGAPETERALLGLFAAFVERGLRVRGLPRTPTLTPSTAQ
jgi:DTW domain-containing protein YfiP